MGAPRRDQARNFFRAQTTEALDALPPGETFQIRLLRGAQDLDSFLGEIIVEAGERQTRPIDRRLADFAMKSDALSFELQLQFPAVRDEETLDGDNRNVLPQIAPGRNGG